MTINVTISPEAISLSQFIALNTQFGGKSPKKFSSKAAAVKALTITLTTYLTDGGDLASLASSVVDQFGEPVARAINVTGTAPAAPKKAKTGPKSAFLNQTFNILRTTIPARKRTHLYMAFAFLAAHPDATVAEIYEGYNRKGIKPEDRMNNATRPSTRQGWINTHLFRIGVEREFLEMVPATATK